MMLVIGAFMIFGLVRLNFQSTALQSEQYMETNTYVQLSATIARAMMDEIIQKKFDAALWTKRIAYTSDLTSCGPGSGEAYPNFNDLDDFHGSVFLSPKIGTTPTTSPRCLWGTEGYRVSISVQYVNQNNPSQISYVPTFAKRVRVQVANTYSDQQFETSHVVCY